MGNKNFKPGILGVLICCLVLVFQVTAQSDKLTGVYRLDEATSTNVFSLVEGVSRQNKLLSPQKMDLQTKLKPTESVSIQVNGNQIALASEISGPTTLNANNKFQTMNASGGSSVSIRTSLIGDTLKVSSIYDNTNYSITFRSINNGRNLQVTRTVKTGYLSQTIFAESFYNRVNSPATFGGFYSTNNRFSNDTYIVPNGTVLTGTLENYISTKDSQNSDQFRLMVKSPSQYEGAVIEGYLSGIERSNGISGTAKLTLNFQKIRLASGQTYEFTGNIQGIDAVEETAVKKTNEGQMRGQNRTKESVKRGVISAGVGAIIGAAIAGKKGALIGAGVGGVGGPATLLFEGNKDIILKQGWQIDVQSTTPDK